VHRFQSFVCDRSYVSAPMILAWACNWQCLKDSAMRLSLYMAMSQTGKSTKDIACLELCCRHS